MQMTLPLHIWSVLSDEIIKFVAARCHIVRLTWTIFDFGWGFAPDPLGAYSAPPDPLAGFKGSTGGEGKEKRGERLYSAPIFLTSRRLCVSLWLTDSHQLTPFFLNVPLKLLLSEAFSAPNALNIFWWPGSARTPWGAYSAPPDLLAIFKGTYF